MHTCSKFDLLWILSRYDKFVMSNLWQNSCKANGIISDHSLAKQVCSKTVAMPSESSCVTMVTSALTLTCCKLVMNLQTCHAELAASLQACKARLLQVCCKLKLLSGHLYRTIISNWLNTSYLQPSVSVTNKRIEIKYALFYRKEGEKYSEVKFSIPFN